MNCFFKMTASKIQRRSGLKSCDTENMVQATEVMCNKEMGHLAAAKNITCFILKYTITFAQTETLFKPPSQNWDVNQLFLQFFKRSLLVLEEKLVEYLLRGNISDSLGTLLDWLSRIKSPVHFQWPKKQQAKSGSNVV